MTNRRTSTDLFRGRRLGLSMAGVALTVALAGCGTAGDDPSASAPATTAAPGDGSSEAPTAAPSSSASSASGTADPGGTDGGSETPADLPSTPLETTEYTGEPRPTQEVYHLACLEPLADGEPIPETEGTGQDENGELQVTPWSLQSGQALTEGWAFCPTELMGGMAIPTSFQVTADGGEGQVSGLMIADSTGQTIGGLRRDVSDDAPEGADVVEVLEIEEQPDYAAAGDETVYLRSLVVGAESGMQLMVDMVSAPEGADPESLEVWDLGVYGGTSRDVVYGTIALESADAAQEAAASDLHAVLREMVGSYHPSMQ